MQTSSRAPAGEYISILNNVEEWHHQILRAISLTHNYVCVVELITSTDLVIMHQGRNDLLGPVKLKLVTRDVWL